MTRGLMVIGTDTGVGKTFVCAGLLGMLLENGKKACYFKPVLSGAKETRTGLRPGDTEFVKQVSGLTEDSSWITPYIFRAPVSPHLASRMEGKKISPQLIRERFRRISSKYDFILSEGAGGLAVPLRDDGYMQYHLVRDLGLPCLLVARTALGTINHTLLTIALAHREKIKIRGIVFNGFTGSAPEKDNIDTIRKLSGLPVMGILPKFLKSGNKGMNKEKIRQWFGESLNCRELVRSFEKVRV